MRTLLARMPQKYRRLALAAETGRDLIIDSLKQARELAEVPYAQAEAVWQESPDGRRYQATLAEIDEAIETARQMPLPDMSVLK